MKLDIQLFAVSGTGKAPRKNQILFVNVGTSEIPEWEIIGKDNEELARTLNNEVESKKNVLGKTETEVTLGNQVTTVDPLKFRRDSKFAIKLQEIYIDDKELDDLIMEFCEVFVEDVIEVGKYRAFTQKGVLDLKSLGGDPKSINMPFDINWVGSKTQGQFAPATKTFSEIVQA